MLYIRDRIHPLVSLWVLQGKDILAEYVLTYWPIFQTLGMPNSNASSCYRHSQCFLAFLKFWRCITFSK